MMKLPDFFKCPECDGDMFKYSRAKKGKAKYLCNDCKKNIELEFGVKTR